MRREVARRWLVVADEDLHVARLCLADRAPALRGAAYHCQQCAEKLIKACLILAEIPFPKTHDLSSLIDLLPEVGPSVLMEAMARVTGLTPWAVVGRYPEALGEPKLPTPAEIKEALRDLHELRALVARAIDQD